jgi:hypothetical protein
MALGLPTAGGPGFSRGIEQAKAWFFDRAKVLNAADKAKVKALSKMGAFVRRSAKSSIRKRKAASQPGNPPSSHTGLLKDNIFFSYEPARGGNVVIGPTALNWVHFDLFGQAVKGIIPRTLEYGGAYRVAEEWVPPMTLAGRAVGGRWRRIDLRRTGHKADVRALLASRRPELYRGRPTRLRQVNIAARPYMRPALELNLPKFAELFRNSFGSRVAA